MDTDITDVLSQCFDSLEAMVEDIANGGSGQLMSAKRSKL